MIPNCMIYDVHIKDSQYFHKMLSDALDDNICIKKVYIMKAGNLYDVLYEFNNIHHMSSTQRQFATALNRHKPVIINYRNKQYDIYLE